MYFLWHTSRQTVIDLCISCVLTTFNKDDDDDDDDDDDGGYDFSRLHCLARQWQLVRALPQGYRYWLSPVKAFDSK